MKRPLPYRESVWGDSFSPPAQSVELHLATFSEPWTCLREDLFREAANSLQVGPIDKTHQQLLHACFFIGDQTLTNRLRTANQGSTHTRSKPGFEFSRHLRQSLLNSK